MSDHIAVVLKGYPRLSETFIAQELLSLEQAGLPLAIWALRRPHDKKTHPVNGLIKADVRYLPEYLYQAPLRLIRAWRKVRKLNTYPQTLRLWLADLWRDPTPNRGRRFGQALILAAELPADARALYAHFLHTPTSVTRYAARLRGLEFAVSAHAKDIYTQADWEKAEKLADARFLTTCTCANVDALKGLTPATASKVFLAYHGLDLKRFPPSARPDSTGPNGSDPKSPVTILSVGRAVPKKGYDVLLEALALLPSSLAWRFEHIGGGAELTAIKARARTLGLTDRLSFRGALAQADVLAAYRSADMFALASKVADDGDRDGLPNVLMEAMSQALPCVSSRVSAIPELIETGVTGLLVPPDDAQALARALAKLITTPALRAQLGAAGEARVRADFSHDATLGELGSRLRQMLEGEIARRDAPLAVTPQSPVKAHAQATP